MEPIERIATLERRVTALSVALVLGAVCMAVVGLRAQALVTENLRVRQITVVDANGKDRVWIGAPVPDPIIQGVQQKRKSPVSGIVLLDAKGNERSGFVTSDPSGEVFLSLDSETEQEAIFLVNPGGGGHLSVYDRGRNLARLGVLGGRPELLLREKGQEVWKQPAK